MKVRSAVRASTRVRPEAAEIVKLLENTFRAVNIGLIDDL